MKRIKNRGVIIDMRETDYLAGTLPYQVRNESGDWTQYVPKGENQYSNMSDSMACVSFSFLNCLETQIKFLRGQEIDFSDRFLAKVSNTTIHGNTLGAVADAYRTHGCPLETDYPKPDNFTWDQFYSEIPEEVFKKAIKYGVNYEWVETTTDSLQYHLKQSPLQLIIPGHAICGVYEDKDIFNFFDTYSPYIKEHQNPPLYAMKIVLNMDRLVKANKDVYRIKDAKKDLFLNAKSFEVLDGRWASIETITQAELDAIPDGNVLIAVPQE